MKIQWTEQGWDDYRYWQATDADMIQNIHRLLGFAAQSPRLGPGKPQRLLDNGLGWYSRRLLHQHRLIYRVTGKDNAQALEIAACRFHYGR